MMRKARNWTLLIAGEAVVILTAWYYALLPLREHPVHWGW